MSTIEDFIADYTGADTNTPQDATAIPATPDQVSDLGFVLRDIKAVVRQESLNKGWEARRHVATQASSSTFEALTADGEDYPQGTAVKMIGATTVYGWVTNELVNEFVVEPFGIVPATLTHVVFGAVKPSSSPLNELEDYPTKVGGPMPARLSQWAQFQISGNATTSVVVPLAKTEPNASYRVMIQAVAVAGGSAANGAYRVNSITKTTTQFTIEIDTAPGSGVTVTYEYGIFRGE